MAAGGTPIRGGKYWRAVAGAVDVDDSGFVVLCPKDKVDNVYVDFATTNSASVRVDRFAKMCKKGFDSAGCKGAKLERIAPMAVDFSSIGPQPVKNLVWRL